MNKLDKFLFKLGKKTRAIIKNAITLITVGDLSLLDIKKLQGSENMFRARIGRVRIIFEKTKFGNKILDMSFRDDNTY